MAKQRAPSIHDTAAWRSLSSFEKVKAWAATIQEHHQKMLDDVPVESLQLAFLWWKGLGVMLEVVDSQRIEHNRNENAVRALASLEVLSFRIHETAVRVLMREAERHNIVSAKIEESGRYCRELLAIEKRSEYCHIATHGGLWPDCLGLTLLNLPGDVRSAIIEGNAVVHRIGVLLEVDKSEVALDAIAANLADDRKCPSEEQIERVKEAIRKVGKSATPVRVLHALRDDNAEGKGMAAQAFYACLRQLSKQGYSGHKRKR